MDEEYIKEDEFSFQPKTDWKEKLEIFLKSRYFVAVILILIAIVSFCLGRISKIGEAREPVRIINSSQTNTNNPLNPPYINGETEQQTRSISSGSENNLQNTAAAAVGAASAPASASQSGEVVASKNGTKYHYPWCAGAKQISDKNKITFNSIEEARAAGYTPATNCKGLK